MGPASEDGGFDVFEKHKAEKAAEQEAAKLALAEQQHANDLATWQKEHDALSAAIQAARTRTGSPSDTMILKSGEAVFCKVTNVSLVEMQKGASHWEGRSQGVSVPIGSIHGRSVRYRVGVSKGHFVQGAPHPAAVDTGEMNITNQRIVFIGGARTVECLFQKLVGVQQSAGEITISVSNRQKPTVIHYGAALDGWVKLRLELALSIFHKTSAAFADSLEQNLKELEARRP